MKKWAARLLNELSRHDASVDTLLRLIWRELRKETVLDRLSISYLHPDGQSLIMGCVLGQTPAQVRTGFREILTAVQKSDLVDQHVTRTSSRHSLQRRSVQMQIESGFRTVVATPLRLNDQLLGTLDASSTKAKAFSRDQLDSLRSAAALLALAHERGQFIGRAYTDREVKLRLRKENEQLREVSIQSFADSALIGESAVWRRQLHQIQQVAATDSTVLIRGETGTGKELIARAIHRLSKRSTKPFIAVNCGSFTRELLASELFGHERGAFTGAIERRLGRFDLAQGGTLLLDEVAELPAEMQVKLLRVLQEREYERVGGTQTHKADVRILAATHRDLETERTNGRFREDLFYRLNVFPLFVPSLRERREDIELLLRHFLIKAETRTGKKFQSIDAACLASCKAYDWPGNVRELENLVERAAILCAEPVFYMDPLGDAVRLGDSQRPTQLLDDVIASHLKQAMSKTNGKIYGSRGAAQLLGLKPSTLQAKLLKYGISKNA